ncbi:MAG: hypothetical protein ACP6IS_12830 [Candidatus Asgardarchaeia archaeon]
MNRKIEFTQKQINQVEALASVLTVEQISEYFGISYVTFGRLRKDNPEIDKAYKKGKAKAIYDVASGLLETAKKGNLTARMFYLKTQAGWREANRTELTGPNGKPIQADMNSPQNVIVDLSSKTTEELLAIHAGLKILKDAAGDAN